MVYQSNRSVDSLFFGFLLFRFHVHALNNASEVVASNIQSSKDILNIYSLDSNFCLMGFFVCFIAIRTLNHGRAI